MSGGDPSVGDAIRIGISPMSWGVALGRNPLQVTWQRFLDETRGAGYGGVELGTLGYLPTESNVLQRELAARGLALAGAQVNADFAHGGSWREALDRVDATCELLNSTGASRLVLLSTYTDQDLDTPTKWSGALERIQEIGRVAQKHGVVAAYHAHAGGGIETEAQIEQFMAETDPSIVSLCFDTGHHAYSGGDVVAFIRQHADRIAHVHLKNVDGEVLERVRDQGLSFSEASRLGVMTELERGLVDLRAVKEALLEVGYRGWAVVEQDRSQNPGYDPAETARRNRRHLREVGF